MAKIRSPRYPSISLGEAINLAHKLWQKEGKTPVPYDVAAKDWSYKSASGPVRAKIGALRQFGLLDGAKDGVKVSDLALQILVHPEGSTEKATAIQKAALKPALFSELYENYRHASEDALKAHLITKKDFTEEGANQFARSFKATLSLANVDDESYADLNVDADDEEEQMEQSTLHTPPLRNPPPPPAQTGSGSLWLKVPFRGSEMTVKVESGGQKLTKGHIERVIKYLELAEDDLEADSPKSPEKHDD